MNITDSNGTKISLSILNDLHKHASLKEAKYYARIMDADRIVLQEDSKDEIEFPSFTIVKNEIELSIVECNHLGIGTKIFEPGFQILSKIPEKVKNPAQAFGNVIAKYYLKEKNWYTPIVGIGDLSSQNLVVKAGQYIDYSHIERVLPLSYIESLLSFKEIQQCYPLFKETDIGKEYSGFLIDGTEVKGKLESVPCTTNHMQDDWQLACGQSSYAIEDIFGLQKVASKHPLPVNALRSYTVSL